MTALLWALKNWKLVAAGVGLLALMSVGSGLYMKGRSDARHAIELRQLKADKEALQERITLTNKLVKSDADQSVKDAEALEEMESQANEFLNKLEDAQRECLSSGDTDGLRKLWNK